MAKNAIASRLIGLLWPICMFAAGCRPLSGQWYYEHGNLGAAADQYQVEADEAARRGNLNTQCDTLMDLAVADLSLGQFLPARHAAKQALDLSRTLADRPRELRGLVILAGVYALSRDEAQAADAIDAGMRLAIALHDEEAAAQLLNQRGTLLAVAGRLQPAAEAFEAAANRSRNSRTMARARLNLALCLLRQGKPADAFSVTDSSAPLMGPSDHDTAMLMLTQGRICWLAYQAGEKRPEVMQRVHDSYLKVQGQAETDVFRDPIALTYSLGYQGEVAEAEGKVEVALTLARRALFAAHEAHSPDAEYRWLWLLARLLKSQGHSTDALAMYDSAIETLQKIRGDIANGLGNQADVGSFRETVGNLYYETADLLLQKADATSDPALVQSLLFKARERIETLKTGEVEDYFQQKCVDAISTPKIDQEAGRGAAVVYIIPLPDRTELLVSTADERGAVKMARFKSAIGSVELTREVREFRTRLEDRTSNRYLLNARKLYDWLIHPMEASLKMQAIDTLVFVPDGSLRTIPMAALNDGKKFLIEDYAVAVAPGLSLVAPKPLQESPRVALEGGLSISQVSGFAPLEYVPAELDGVHKLYAGQQLLNQSFTAANLKSQMDQGDFTVVHLASHAEFSHDEAGTFLLTYDKKLSLRALSSLIRRHKFSDQPVELLALSACQTAAGDDRAALGLAGVAIAMGARSAVATLWSVNDQASSELVQQFYKSLAVAPSKAKAMQRAQVEVLHEARYHHPCYWAPYMVIGNWL